MLESFLYLDFRNIHLIVLVSKLKIIWQLIYFVMRKVSRSCKSWQLMYAIGLRWLQFEFVPCIGDIGCLNAWMNTPQDSMK